jgi:hypothetical protein
VIEAAIEVGIIEEEEGTFEGGELADLHQPINPIQTALL